MFSLKLNPLGHFILGMIFMITISGCQVMDRNRLYYA